MRKEKVFDKTLCNLINESWKDTVELILITSVLLVIRIILIGKIPACNSEFLFSLAVLLLGYFIICALNRFYKTLRTFDNYLLRGAIFLLILEIVK